jgi:hypothetical protein
VTILLIQLLNFSLKDDVSETIASPFSGKSLRTLAQSVELGPISGIAVRSLSAKQDDDDDDDDNVQEINNCTVFPV